MNAKQRRTAKRKVLFEAIALGIDVPRWASIARVWQLIREEKNRRAREAKRKAKASA